MTELTDIERSEYEAKRVELEQELKAKVHCCVQVNPKNDERIVTYLKEPAFQTKLYLMDKSATIGPFMAADELRQIAVIQEHSHLYSYSDLTDAEPFKLGVVSFCINMISMATDQFKKK